MKEMTIKPIDDTTLSAYSDGELPTDEAHAVAAALATDPELQQRLQQLQSVDSAARSWFTQGDDEPLPAGLEQLILDKPMEPARVVPLPRRIPLPAWGLAASVVLGITLYMQQPEPVSPQIQQFADTARTGEILEGDGWRAEIASSYENAQSERCREIIQHTPEESITLRACGSPGDWHWQINNSDNAYHTASGPEEANRQLLPEEERQWLNGH